MKKIFEDYETPDIRVVAIDLEGSILSTSKGDIEEGEITDGTDEWD